MRNTILLTSLAILVFALVASFVNRVSAAESVALSSVSDKWRIAAGDQVNVSLVARAGESPMQISGTVESFDADVLRLRYRYDKLIYSDSGNAVESHDVLRIVPWPQVLFLDKQLAPPTTQPTLH